jgi:hypothetical protein
LNITAVISEFVFKDLLFGRLYLLDCRVEFFRYRGAGLALDEKGPERLRIGGDIEKILPSGRIRLGVQDFIQRCL